MGQSERGDTMRWISFSVLLVVTVGGAQLLQHQVHTGAGADPQLQLTDTDRQPFADLSLPVVRREAESKKKTKSKRGKKAKGNKLKQGISKGRKKEGNNNKNRATKKKRNKAKRGNTKKEGRKQNQGSKGARKKKEGDKAK